MSSSSSESAISNAKLGTESGDDIRISFPGNDEREYLASLAAYGDDGHFDVIAFNKASAELQNKTRKFRFHVLGLVHVPVSRRFDACAFTQKIVKLCIMLRQRGHTVILYGCQGSDLDLCDEFVQTHTLADIRRDFGKRTAEDYPGFNSADPDDLGYDWRKETFRTDFDRPHPSTEKYYAFASARIITYCWDKKDDFLLLTMGYHQKPIADKVGLYLTVEPGIGYYGSYADFRAFESTAAEHYMLSAAEQQRRETLIREGKNPGGGGFSDGKFYWRTIPNYYIPSDFVVHPDDVHNDVDGAISHSKQYYLFQARLIQRKGFYVVFNLCKELGLPLWICGQGVSDYDEETRTLTLAENGCKIVLAENMKFLGYANARRRALLMTNALAVFCFTLFIEPFCGVNVESQLCGTPVITTLYGAFVDTVEQGKTGFRCGTTDDIVLATRLVQKLDREYIKSRALRLYSTDSVSWMFEKFFQDLYEVYLSTKKQSKGFSEIRPSSTNFVAELPFCVKPAESVAHDSESNNAVVSQ